MRGWDWKQLKASVAEESVSKLSGKEDKTERRANPHSRHLSAQLRKTAYGVPGNPLICMPLDLKAKYKIQRDFRWVSYL